jgi:hypothetical protein
VHRDTAGIRRRDVAAERRLISMALSADKSRRTVEVVLDGRLPP